MWKGVESIWNDVDSMWKCMKSMGECMESMGECMESIAEYMEQKHSTWNPPGMWGQGKVLVFLCDGLQLAGIWGFWYEPGFLALFFGLFCLFPISSPLSLALQNLLLNIFVVCFILGVFTHLLGRIRPLALWGGEAPCWRPLRVIGALDGVAGVI